MGEKQAASTWDPYLTVMALMWTFVCGATGYLAGSAVEPTQKPVQCPPPEYVVLPTPEYETRVPLLALEDPFEGVSIPEPEEDMAWPVPVAARCQWTRVSGVGPRLESGAPGPGIPTDFSSGISVAFENGVGLVSYTSNPAIESTRVGSRVQVCLYEQMRGCPPGDDRGKSYRVYDPTQGIAWSMGDSQHVCGGA
ncbi:MAG: hypothetical protein RLZZ299_2446 [Pseudomonadota bacterium]|jgi:hypothetical protein